MGELLIVGSATLVPPNNPTPSHSNPSTTNSKARKCYNTKHSPARLSRTTAYRPPLLTTFHQNVIPQHRVNYYADLASKLAQDGRLEDFLMIIETVLFSISDPSLFVASLNIKLVSVGVSTLVADGRIQYVIQVLSRIQKLGIIPSALFDKSVTKLLALECNRLIKARKLKEVVDFMETLTGFLFPVKELAKPSQILKLCIEESDPDTAVRYAYMLPQSHIFLSSIILEFGKKGDLMSAVVAYEASKCKSDGPNMYVCRTMIDVCGLCGDFSKSRFIYEGLLAQKVIPNAYVFNSLMNVNAQDLSYALQVYKQMKNLGVSPDMASYNVLLKACCRAGKVELAQGIYKEARHSASVGRLKLDVITYSTIIKAFADAKMWQMALKIKEDMLSDGVRPNVVTWSSLISACANAGLVEQATQVFEEMLLKGCEPNSLCCNSLLYACVEAGQYDRAFRIFRTWRESGIQRIIQTKKSNPYDHVHLGAENLSENCTTNSHNSNSNSKPYYLSFAKVVPFAPTIATFNILMKACGTDYYRANGLMDEMKIAGLSPNHISWSILIDICGRTGNVGGSVQALKAMRDNGIKPDVIAYTTAIKACVRNKSLKLAFSLFEEMKRYRVKPNMVTYDTLLRARRRYGSLREVQQCLAIYQDMRKAGYSPNDYFLKELIEEWCEGVLADYRDEGIVGRSVLHHKTDREISQSMLLEKIAAYLQRDVSQSLAVDLRGLTKVESRIVVLAVLRMIKEKYTIGDTLEDDIVIILGARKEDGGKHNKYEVQDAVVKLLRDELGLSVVLAGAVIRNDDVEPSSSSSARRPAVLRRLKVTRKSLYNWLHKRIG